MARTWCKVSASLDSHPKVRKAGNLGRQVFEFALRRNAELDLGGFVPMSYMEPWYLADALMLTDCPDMSGQDQAVSGLSRAVHAGLLVQHGNGYSIAGWDDEWSKQPKTEAERKRQQRARSRNDSPQQDESRSCPDTIVTDRDCPDSHTREEKRREERGSDPASPIADTGKVTQIAPAQKPQRSAPRRALDPAWSPSRTEAILDVERTASARGVDVAFELVQLRDWALGKGERKADWDATWRGWLRRARPQATNGNGSRAIPERRNLMRPM